MGSEKRNDARVEEEQAAGELVNRVDALLAPLHHEPTAWRVRAERALNQRLEGGCQVPIGGHATLQDGELHLRGLVGTVDGSEILRAEIRGPQTDAERLGGALAEELLAHGAAQILRELYCETPSSGAD